MIKLEKIDKSFHVSNGLLKKSTKIKVFENLSLSLSSKRLML